MVALKPRTGSLTLTPPEELQYDVREPQKSNSASAVTPRSMYVYLTSGAISVVPAISHVTLTADRMLLLREGVTVAVYPRKSVYFASRQKECPPAP